MWQYSFYIPVFFGQTYVFQAYYRTLTDIGGAFNQVGPLLRFQLSLNGGLWQALGADTLPLPPGCQTYWLEAACTWTAPSNGFVQLRLQDSQPGYNGNDFAIDDVFFGLSSNKPFCAVGYYCPGGSGAPVLCLMGSYCPLSSMNPTPCPAGTWSAATGASANATCTRCSAGTYSTFVGAAAPSTCAACPAGTFSTSTGAASSAACSPCAAGSYSAAGATSCAYTASTCPVGTYASAPASCAACSPATACTVPGLSAQPPCYWNVSTLAGSGAAGWADGQGTAAAFNGPVGMALDPVSQIVGDIANYRVRRITPSGAVTTFAGSGSAGFADGAGAAASFDWLHGVSVDSIGNVYVGDYSNKRIRKILPSGLVLTLAGNGIAGGANGIGTNAQFFGPTDFALDQSGIMGYVVDQQNNRVRSIALATASVSTLAGSGFAGFADGTGVAAQFSAPTSAVWHPSGTLYVGDGEGSNHRVRRINIATKAVDTLAGNGAAGGSNGVGTSARFNFPRGVALDATFSTLYVAEQGGNRIRSVDLSTALVQTVAGSGIGGFGDAFGVAAAFSAPIMLDTSSSGVLFTAEYGNHRIRQLTCVPCPASYYCASGAPVLCPAGSYCPRSSINPTLCPEGTFSPALGASSNATCTLCVCTPACAAGSSADPSCTPSATASGTGSARATASGSATRTAAPTASAAGTPSSVPSGTATRSVAGSATGSGTPSATGCVTGSSTGPPSQTGSGTPSGSGTAVTSATATGSGTSSLSGSGSPLPTL